MAWIKTVAPESDPAIAKLYQELRAIYPAEYGTPVPGMNETIMASHTLIPEAMFPAFATFAALMSPELPLTRRQHEMITTVVSATNRCFY